MQRGTIPLMGDGFYTAITTGTPVADTNGGLEAVDGTGYDGRLRLAGDSRRGQPSRQAHVAVLAVAVLAVAVLAGNSVGWSVIATLSRRLREPWARLSASGAHAIADGV